MTKSDSNILCPHCYYFDYCAFDRGVTRFDTLTLCSCDFTYGENPEEEIREFFKSKGLSLGKEKK